MTSDNGVSNRPRFSPRALAAFGLLSSAQTLARVFYRIEMKWLGQDLPPDPWSQIRIVAVLNHTSLYEPLFTGGVPSRFLWRIASRGIIPVAQKTIQRPLTGLFFRFIAAKVAPITRQRDDTWTQVIDQVDDESMVVLAPEGRMRRATGLDSKGQPMTVRGGIADLLERIPGGPMLLAYSGGLHHVQIPGQRLPRLFRTIRMNLERVDIESYRSALNEAVAQGLSFKQAVIQDLERRRDENCPIVSDTTAPTPSHP